MPAHPYDPNCYCLTCAWSAQEELKSEMARSRAQKTIEISKVRDRGSLPAFIPLIHRHFQKSLPAIASKKQATLNAPVDLLDMVVPDPILESIESIEIIYETRE